MLQRWRTALFLAVAVTVTVILSACGGTTTTGTTPAPTSANTTPGATNCVTGSITASGSTALQPFVDAVAKKYQAKCSGAQITVQPGGSKKGLTDAESGASAIGNSDVPSDPTTQSDLVDHQVAIVIFTLIVNPDVTGVTDIKTSDVQGIYSGKITNWKQIGGPDKTITVVSRPTTSGTRATFKKYMLAGANETPAKANNLTVDSTGAVVDTITQTSGSIGYVALGGALAAGSKIVVLKIDGTDATAANVATNAYKFWNVEHMYTKGAATGLAQAFLDYMVSSDAGSVADSLSFVKISDVPQSIRDTHK